MGYYSIAAPGTEFGPCLGECQHRECAETRRQSESFCIYCKQPIGYDKPMYFMTKTGLAHAGCLWQHEEQEKKNREESIKQLELKIRIAAMLVCAEEAWIRTSEELFRAQRLQGYAANAIAQKELGATFCSVFNYEYRYNRMGGF